MNRPHAFGFPALLEPDRLGYPTQTLVQQLGDQVALLDVIASPRRYTRLVRPGFFGSGTSVANRHGRLRVVQVPHRQRAQALEARVIEDVALAPQRARRGRHRQRTHRTVPLGQQRHVGRRGTPLERMRGGAVPLGQRLLPGHPARHQACHLRAAVAAQALQVDQHHASVATPQRSVVQTLQHGADPCVPACVVLRGPELQGLRAQQPLAHLLHGAHLCLVHVDHHHQMIDARGMRAAHQPANRRPCHPPPGSHVAGNTPRAPGSHRVGQDWGGLNLYAARILGEFLQPKP